MQPGVRIDYKVLRRVNPEAARLAVVEYLESCQRNITATARAFGITRPVVYDIVKRHQEGDLTDRSWAPKHQPQKTPAPIEEAVVAAKNKIRLGPQRLSIYLAKYQGLRVPYGTIRHILRRNRHRLTYLTVARHRRGSPRPFVDWYAAKPFEIVQVDVKFIRDHKAPITSGSRSSI